MLIFSMKVWLGRFLIVTDVSKLTAKYLDVEEIEIFLLNLGHRQTFAQDWDKIE